MHRYQHPFGRFLTLKERFASLWVTMGVCGISPIGPGTVGSVVAAGLVAWLYPMSLVTQILGIVMVTIVGIACIEYLQRKQDDVQDASWIVIDEGVGIWIALLGWDGSWQMLLAALVLFRLLDIFKPFPVSYFDEKGHEALWVMMDDVVAGVFAWGLLYVMDAARVFV